jgi:hypothetical protein
MAPTPGYTREQEGVLRLAWRTLDSEVRHAVWRSVMRGEAVAHPGHRRLAVWLSRRHRRIMPVHGAAGLATGLLAASLLSGMADPPMPLVALALAFGLAQPFVAYRRWRRLKAAETANLPPAGQPRPAAPDG